MIRTPANLSDIYTNRTVLVTGHTGFKGSWLALWLNRLGAHVVGYALDPPSTPCLFDAAGVSRVLKDVRGDILDSDGLDRVLQEHRPDIVFHLAAQPLVRLSYEQPDLTFETNVLGSLRVFEAIRRSESVRVLVNVTSDKCYENREWVWGYRENDPMGGYDPYSASKGCAELLFSAWYRSYFDPAEHGRTHSIAAASVRAGNVIGGGDWGRDRLIPECVRALSKDERIVIRSPAAVRPWQHVLEPLSGYLQVGARLFEDAAAFGGPWNFGPATGEEWTVREVVERLCALWGNGAFDIDGGHHPHEAHWLKLDCTKAHHQLGWRPRWSTRRAIETTARWYRAFHEGADENELFELSIDQIAAYETSGVSGEGLDDG